MNSVWGVNDGLHPSGPMDSGNVDPWLGVVYFHLVSGGQESVKANDELWVSFEEAGYPCDHTRSVD